MTRTIPPLLLCDEIKNARQHPVRPFLARRAAASARTQLLTQSQEECKGDNFVHHAPLVNPALIKEKKRRADCPKSFGFNMCSVVLKLLVLNENH